MTRETLETLNTSTLIGHTDHRGTAWHYRAELQHGEPNHYPGAIPVEDVQRRLFSWTAQSRPVGVELPATVETMTHLNPEGQPARWARIDDRQAVTRSDNDHVMGIFTNGYQRHQYDQWLLTSVANILDDTLSISSAGLLRGGAVAWVEVSMPESIRTPEGVEFRPNLLATTSFDGSIATTYKRTITATVCDNTRDLALSESGQELKVKHSRRSNLRLVEARDALHVVHTTGDAFSAEVAQLCATPVSFRQWSDFLDALIPRHDGTGNALEGRALTQADNKRDKISSLYWHDVRVEPWANTAYGVIQAINTYEHHETTVRGKPRPERNMLRAINGDFSRLDSSTWQTLHPILAAA